MKAHIALAGLALLLAMPLPAAAQEILSQRLNNFANRVEGVFAKDQVGHMIKTLQGERDLALSLIVQKRAEIIGHFDDLDMIEKNLASLLPDYQPLDHRLTFTGGASVGVETTTSLKSLTPEKITSCTLNPDGSIAVCSTQ